MKNYQSVSKLTEKTYGLLFLYPSTNSVLYSNEYYITLFCPKSLQNNNQCF